MSCYQRRCSPNYAYYFQEAEKDLTNTQIKDKDDHYLVYLDLPGFLKENIEIEIVQDTLTVHATKTDKDINKEFKLPKEVDREQVSAKIENGVLEVTLKKHPVFKKTIQIE